MFQNTPKLPECTLLIRKKHDSESAQNMVECRIRKIHIFGIANFDLSIEPASLGFCVRRPHHFVSEVKPNDIASVPNSSGGGKEYGAQAARDVENFLARLNAGRGDETLAEMGKATRPVVIISYNGVELHPGLSLPIVRSDSHKRLPPREK